MRTALITSLALTGILALPGCDADPPPSPSRTTTSSAPTKTPDEPADALVSRSPDSGAKLCLQSVRRRMDVGYWDYTMTARTPLRITGVRAGAGSGVRVLGGIAAPVIGRMPHQTVVSEWPLPRPDRFTRRSVDWPARTSLIGMRLPVERAVLPLLHLRAGPGGRLDAITISYLTDAGKVGVLVLPVALRFSRGKC